MDTIVSSQFNWSSTTKLAFRLGYGDNSGELGFSPGTNSLSDAIFPGLIRGTVTNTRSLGWESNPDDSKVSH